MKLVLAFCAILHGCAVAPAPAAADALPKGVAPRHAPSNALPSPAASVTTTDPLGYVPAVFPRIPGGASSERIFDRPLTGGGSYGPAPWAPGRGSLVTFIVPGIDIPIDDDGEPPYTPPPRPEPPSPPDNHQPGVPGPLPVLGVAAAWGWARRIRRRVR